MSIETDLFTTLSTTSGVTTLVSTRIYAGMARETPTFPYVTYQMISGSRLSTVTGVGDAKRKLIQISCHAETYAGAKALGDAVVAALEGGGYLEHETEFYDPLTQIHTVINDWSFMA
jgi:hypothetical protein